jgi:hypothetical protein
MDKSFFRQRLREGNESHTTQFLPMLGFKYASLSAKVPLGPKNAAYKAEGIWE